MQVGSELSSTIKHATDVKHSGSGSSGKAILDLGIMIHGSNPQMVASAPSWLRTVVRPSSSMRVRLPAVRCLAVGWTVGEDLNSNQAADFVHPLGSQLLVDSSLMTPRPHRGEPLAKLESKVSKVEDSVLGSARTSVGPDASQGL